MKMRIFILGILSCGLFFSKAYGFYTTFDTADTLEPGHYQLGLEPQYIFTRIPGANVIGHLDMGTPESSGNFKFLLGAGTVNYQIGGFYKYTPFPDVGNQPGIGGFFGVLYSYKDNNAMLSFRFHPLVSKKFVLEEGGQITPYASIPFGIAATSGTTTYPLQIALGARWLPPQFKNLNFWLELGMELNSAFSYVTTGVTVPFESFDTLKIN